MISSEIQQSSLRQYFPSTSEEPRSEDSIAEIAQTCFRLTPIVSSRKEGLIRTIPYRDGSLYTGQTVNGQAHGHGLLIKKNEHYYEGDFDHGVPCGHGIGLDLKKGSSYKGGYNARVHGRGILIKKEGQHYEGTFENGYYHGTGTRFNPDGSATKGIFAYGQKINSNISEIGNADFIGPLFSLSLGSSSIGNVLGVLIKYLNQYDEYQQYGNALSQIHQRLQIFPENYEQEAEKIHHQLTEKGQPQLLLYGMNGHSMILYLVPDLDGKFINCEIFNSGKGLNEYHEKKAKKFQTMLRVKAEKEKITKKTIELFLNYLKFQHIAQPYRAIFDLGERQKQPLGEEVWQAPQKERTCPLECLFALFRNKIPTYYKLRWLVFKTCIETAKKSEEPQTQKFLERYRKEINEKLKKKYEKYSSTNLSASQTDETLESCQISEEEQMHLQEKIQFIECNPVHYANGSCYQGQIQNGKASGFGRLTCANGDHFEGQFVIGQLHGFGLLTYAKGVSYEGELVLGKPNGFGKLSDANGDLYEGEFILGRSYGYGRLTYSNRDCFEGEFIMGKPYFGKFTSASGEENSYTGRFIPKKTAPLTQKSPPSRKRKADWLA